MNAVMSGQELLKQCENLNILYVEDNENTRISTEVILNDLFKEVYIAKDGIEGLEKFKNNNIDIVITDIKMPQMNGLEMSQKIKTISSHTPVLIFSAHNEINFFSDSIKIGIDGYLLKPLDFTQFTLTLFKVINHINLRKENLDYKNNLEKKVQEQLEELREKDNILFQQTKMAAMGEMMDAIAHQWKQPLSSISMKSDFLGELISENQEVTIDDIKDCSHMVSESISHLVHTIDEFRKFFRPNYNLILVNIKDTLESVSLLLKDELVKKQIKLNIIADESLFIRANENDIKHLFINLINNAKDEMINSNIEEEKRVIKINCIQNGSFVDLTVEDNGKGINESIIDSTLYSECKS
jgi:YesN/AraC family two-component response regulator